jgi:hypothetical protein
VGSKMCLFAKGKKSLSASEQERRDEENRRRMRQDDVVIGKTSAKKGETDCALDPQATEQEFLKHASVVEQKVFRLTEAGMEYLKSVGKLLVVVVVQKRSVLIRDCFSASTGKGRRSLWAGFRIKAECIPVASWHC